MEEKDWDEYFMRAALIEARKAGQRGEVPVGAVVVSHSRILSRGRNQTIARNDPSAHAEIVALRRASKKRHNFRLTECDLYVTLEPCPMCVGACVQARIRRLFFGAADPKSGALVSVLDFPFEKMNHKIDFKGGILSEECGKILRDFFLERR